VPASRKTDFLIKNSTYSKGN